ncbi:MAG: PaaI family thioesterase [Candidatus Eisenbacteria bacterium]
MSISTKSVQETHAPGSICFGCGPSNQKGLRIRSFADPKGNGLLCEWEPDSHHEAFPGMLSGGIVGTLLDCHSNWTAAMYLKQARGLDEPPCTVTADFHVRLLRPTPSGTTIHMKSEVLEHEGDKVRVRATLNAGGKDTATCEGTFVAVREGHPAYHRWQ